MRKIILLILICIFCLTAYFSKKEYYEKSIEFYRSNFNGEIHSIVKGRGTKIYYDKDKFFYESDFEGIKLRVGDLIQKRDFKIVVMRKNSNGEYVEAGIGESKKPEDNYFSYFFGI